MGRSRIISANADRDYKDFTSEQTKDDNSSNKSKRKDIRVKDFEETKLLNFYNIAGIRFQNIAANDALISSKLTDMLAEGWDLAFVTSAVESDAGDKDGQGIFITRYIFKRALWSTLSCSFPRFSNGCYRFYTMAEFNEASKT